MGHKALLLTQSKETIGQMSCNPAIGGVGKGHLVKEIDALGGVMALAADHAGIHFKTLNASKGKAVQATRAQADRDLYKKAIQNRLNNLPGLFILEGMAARLIFEANAVTGVETEGGQSFYTNHVILTVGTFLNGKIHIGEKQTRGGRVGDGPSIMLADQLREIAPRTGRLKTGTPPRLLKRSINFSVLEEQTGDNPRPVFSFLSSREDQPEQVSCFIAYTNKNTHSIIKKALSSSPLFTGAIEGVGPRYCPSIEDKVTKFIDKTRHQIFIEPEGLFSEEVYPNGISTSLSLKNQESFVRSIVGFDIGRQIIKAVQAGILEKGGGHKMAGGFTLKKENIPKLRNFLIKDFEKSSIDLSKNRILYLDSTIAPSALNEDFYNDVNCLAPFGSGNREPRFVIENIKVISARIVANNHIKSILAGKDGSTFNGFVWNGKNSSLEPFLSKSYKKRINIAGKMKLNHWRGHEKVEFIIEDVSLN